jgi:hypothetical protein
MAILASFGGIFPVLSRILPCVSPFVGMCRVIFRRGFADTDGLPMTFQAEIPNATNRQGTNTAIGLATVRRL